MGGSGSNRGWKMDFGNGGFSAVSQEKFLEGSGETGFHLPMKILETERLYLRVWSLDDIDAACDLWGDPEVMRFVDDGQPLDPGRVPGSLKAGLDHQEKHGCQHWAVLGKEDDQIIGCCGFNVFEGGPDLELVFHFRPPFWGRGYATEAAAACLEYACKSLHPPQIVAGTHPGNTASRRVLEKLGFQFQQDRWFEDTRTAEPFYTWSPSREHFSG